MQEKNYLHWIKYCQIFLAILKKIIQKINENDVSDLRNTYWETTGRTSWVKAPGRKQYENDLYNKCPDINIQTIKNNELNVLRNVLKIYTCIYIQILFLINYKLNHIKKHITIL